MKKRKFVRTILLVILLLCIAFFICYFKFSPEIIYKKVIEFGVDKGISLADIINSAIGAFFGMITSLMLEKIIDSSQKKKTIDNIISELLSIKIGINNQIIKNLAPEIIHTYLYGSNQELIIDNETVELIDKYIKDMSYVIYVPIWETVLQTGDILEFKNKKYFEELILIYTKIYKIKILIDNYYEEKTFDGKQVINIVRECLELNQMFTDNKYKISALFN